MSVRILNRVMWLAVAAAACVAVASPVAGVLPVVASGKPVASIVVSPGQGSCEKWARELQAFVQKSTGAVLPIVQECPGVSIRLEIAPKAHEDFEEFTFTFPDERSVVVSGGSEAGLKFGVYAFLARYVGLRRLFPGPLGDYCPRTTELSIPRVPVQERPKYLSRYLGAGSYRAETKAFYDWSRSLGANNPRIWIRHFLWALLPQEKYGSSHPEWYPVFNGRRSVPAPGQHNCWQPCFTAPGLAEELAKNAIAYLAENAKKGLSPEAGAGWDPRNSSVSLGVNDAGGFCECEACRALRGPANLAGLADDSRSYVSLVNRVADMVTKAYPDCRIPFDAYHQVMGPPAPGTRLNPRLVPVICYDEMYTAEATRKASYRALISAWHDASPELGCYDYVYGGAFILPRLYPSLTADFLRWNFRHGVRHYYGEFAPGADWTEGPKAYLILKLLWNPDADVEAILDEWYTCAVGAAAAPFLRAYFRNLERFWLNEVPKTEWFLSRRIYPQYGRTDYLDVFTLKMLAENEALLRKVRALSKTPEEQARADYFLKLFLARKPAIETYWKNQETRRQAAVLDFSDQLLSVDFDRGPKWLATWQSRDSKATFFREEHGGVGHSACLGIDAAGTNRRSALYEARVEVAEVRSFRVSARFRAGEGFPSEGRASLMLYWRDAQGRKFGGAYDVQERLPAPYDDEWRTLVAYTRTPEGAALPLRLCVGMGISLAAKGKVRFDELLVEATAAPIKGEETFTRVLQEFSFDKPPLNWAHWQSGKGIAFRRETTGGRAGAGLVLDCSAASPGGRGMYVRDVPCAGETELLVSCWAIVSEAVPLTGGAYVTVSYLDASKKPLAPPQPVRPAQYPSRRDGGWRRLALLAQVPAGAQWMRVVLCANRAEPGSVIFDDVAIAGRAR